MERTYFQGEYDERFGSEDWCRLLAETALVFIMHINRDGAITYINRYAEQITGYNREEVIGKIALEVFAPERTRQTLSERTLAIFEGESMTGFEHPVLTKSGEERMFLWSMALTHKPDGDVSGVVVSGIDLTEFKKMEVALRESEEKYRTLVDHSLAGIFIVQGTKFVFANKRAEEILGYTLEEVQDRDFWEFVDPNDRELVKERAFRRLRGEEVPEHYEYTMLTKHAGPRVAEIWAARIEYMGKLAILATVLDITERRRAEDDRLRSQMELERHKREFLRQTIAAITQGKLDVVDPEAARDAMQDPQVTVEVAEPEDVSLARRLVSQFARGSGLDGQRLEEFLLAVGEAMVNTIKHGGGGIVHAGLRDGSVWVGVMDMGPGMDSLVLTQVVSRRGFSTKPSLGFGYTLILGGSDHVMLATSPEGTIVVMEKGIVEPPATPPVELNRIPSL